MGKRFKVYKVIGGFQEWSIEDTFDDSIVFRSIMHKYEADKLCKKLNDMNDRADRNAELLDIDCVAQYKFCKDVRRIMRKYEINSLEKLDMCLREQRIW